MLVALAALAVVISSGVSFAGAKYYLDRQYKETSEVALRRHAALVSAASHELRTPLNNILGLISTLKPEYKGLSSRGQKTYTQLSHSGGELHRILIDVLEIFDLSDRNIEITPKAVNVTRFVQESLVVKQNKFKNEYPKLTLSYSHGEDIWAEIDPVRFRQCLETLVQQAAFQTKTGTVTVSLSRQSNGKDGQTLLTLKVADDSVGMDQYKADKFFDPEKYEMNPALNGRPSAMLSMNLAKGIAEIMGGTISAKSQLRGGTEFLWSLPATIAQAQEVAEPARKATAAATPVAAASTNNDGQAPQADEDEFSDLLDGLLTDAHVLIVDDNETNLMVLEAFLSIFEPARISKASGGYQAIEIAKESPCDLIFMDIQMPDIDGLETTKVIRKLEPRYAKVPIVAISAGSRVDNIPKCKAVGMNGYVEKPVSEDVLTDTIFGIGPKVQQVIKSRAA